MSQQIQITGGAKVRNLEGVLTGTAGVVNALGINVPSGIPQLDGSGKILVSQLPNSVMEYKGTWNAATNTPTLVNGTGNQGDVYLCNVAGTVNFGAGAITFAVGDQAIYSGTIWQKAGGSTGTVTSVAVTETGDALTITGSPITTSGTINIGFAGISSQYVNGAGGLTTFPTLISSIGLSMPSAFTVTNSPLTANGTIAVTGAGVASQYVRGDGTLANFPTSGGGGGSVSYYFNSSVSQGTLGGVAYRELNKVPVIGAGTDITIATNGYIANYITDVGDPALLEIPGGNWNFEVYFSASSAGGTPSFYLELYKYDGTTFTLISSSSATPEGITGGTAIDLYTTALAVPTTALTLTDRLAVRVYVNNSGRTITLHTENNHLCQVITTFSTGITAINGLTAQVQFFGTGTSGTDFNISSATATHTFNLPVASATNTGKLSSTDWSTFNNKLSTSTAAATYVPYTGATANLNLGTFGITSGGISSSGIAVSHSAGVSASSGATTINGDVNGIRINPVTASNNTLSFPASGSRTYTYPNATGTLALTSDLSSYLPLTGGTLSGALNINLGSGTGLNVSTENVVFRASPTYGSPRQLVFSMGSGPTTTLEAKGYGANYITDFNIKTYNASGTAFNVFFGSAQGNVGIGTDTPGAIFEINIPNVGNTDLLRFSNSAGGSGDIAKFQYGASGQFVLNLLTNASANRNFGIINGNVGIGTSSPGSLLTLYATTTPTIAFQNAGAVRGYLSADSGNNIYNAVTGNGHVFQCDSTERMRIISTGGLNVLSSTGDSFCIQLNSGVKLRADSSTQMGIVNAAITSYADLRVQNMTKASGSFRISHPLESLSLTHDLVHSFVEAPKADLIYRGKVNLVNGKGEANIDDMATMTQGTFEVLCKDIQCFTTNESGWDLVKGKVIGNIIYIESQNINSTDEISWMVIGERKDREIKDSILTDNEGNIIVEPLKQNSSF